MSVPDRSFCPRLPKYYSLSFPQLLIKPNVTVSGSRLLASSHPKPSINLLFTKSYSSPVARYLVRMEVLARPLVRTGLLVPTELCHLAMEASDILAGEITSLIVFLASQLTWIFSQFYLATNDNPQSCDFAGNATVNSASPTSAAAVNAAVTSCFAATPAVYTPLTPTTTLALGAHTSGSAPHSSGGSTGGAVSIFADRMALIGVIVASLCVLGGGAMLA
jgi:hypothetical protein